MKLYQLLEYAQVDAFAEEKIRQILQPLFDMTKDELGVLAEHISLARAKGIVSHGSIGLKAANTFASLKDLVWSVYRAKEKD